MNTTKKLCEELLDEGTWGNIAVLDLEDKIVNIPMSFVRINQEICFHTVPETLVGKLTHKMMCFSCVQELSFIEGSLMTSSGKEGIGTVFYRSIITRTNPRIVTNITEKCSILNALAYKFQPSGKFKLMQESNRALKRMVIFCLDFKNATYRARLGENLSKKVQLRILENLQVRGTPLDLKTRKLMAQSLSVPLLSETKNK